MSSLNIHNPMNDSGANPLKGGAELIQKTKEQTHMTNPPGGQSKMVKIKAVHPIRLSRGGQVGDMVVTEGQTVDVTEAEAKEFCDKDFNIGHRNTFGYQDVAAPHSMVKRAVRV